MKKLTTTRSDFGDSTTMQNSYRDLFKNAYNAFWHIQKKSQSEIHAVILLTIDQYAF